MSLIQQWKYLVVNGVFIVCVFCVMRYLDVYGNPRVPPENTKVAPVIVGYLSDETGDRLRYNREILTNSSITKPRNGQSTLKLCEDKDLFLFVYIHSSALRFANRAIIRTTWGNPALYTGTPMQVVFMLATPTSEFLLRNAESESRLYGDIVILPHVETYVNVSLKAVASIRLVSEHCKHVPFVLKADDDVVVNMFSVIDFLQNRVDEVIGRGVIHPSTREPTQPRPPPIRSLLMCCVWVGSKPIRDKRHKWYISEKDFPATHYPNFCSGTAWVMSIDSVASMSDASHKSSVYPFDDVWLTGMLAKQEAIPHLQVSHHCMDGEFKSRDVLPNVVFAHIRDLHQFQSLWSSMLSSVVKPTLNPKWVQ